MGEQFHIDLTGSLLCSRPGLGRRTLVCSAVFTRYDSFNTYLIIAFLSVPFAYPPFRVILSRLCCGIWFDHHSLRYEDGFVCIVSRVCHDLGFISVSGLGGCLLFFFASFTSAGYLCLLCLFDCLPSFVTGRRELFLSLSPFLYVMVLRFIPNGGPLYTIYLCNHRFRLSL